jgi:hypothetical protein
MKVYGGIDLHSDNSVLGLINEEDQGCLSAAPAQ